MLKLMVSFILLVQFVGAVSAASSGWSCGTDKISYFLSYHLSFFGSRNAVNKCCDQHHEDYESGTMSRYTADRKFCGCLGNVDQFYTRYILRPAFCSTTHLYTFVNYGLSGGHQPSYSRRYPSSNSQTEGRHASQPSSYDQPAQPEESEEKKIRLAEQMNALLKKEKGKKIVMHKSIAALIALLAFFQSAEAQSGWTCGTDKISYLLSYYISYFGNREVINKCCHSHDMGYDSEILTPFQADREFCSCLGNIDQFYSRWIIRPLFCGTTHFYTIMNRGVKGGHIVPSRKTVQSETENMKPAEEGEIVVPLPAETIEQEMKEEQKEPKKVWRYDRKAGKMRGMSSNDADNSGRMEKKEANGLTEKQSTIAMKLAERLVGQSDGSQDPTDEVITWSELVKEEEDEKEKDAALQVNIGYLPRQTLFICLTCTPSPQQAGICLGCSENCHEGHELVELYTKRKFCCDCGNSKFTAKCKLFEEKQPENQLNAYNHNYVGLFCHCNQPYPSPLIEEEEHQCVICEDWFHMTHIDPTFNVKDEELQKKMNGPGSMVCNSCIAKVPFLLPLESEADTSTVCFSKDKPFSVPQDKRFFLLAVKWRNRICKCAECIAIMEMAQCEYLIDSEDDLDVRHK
ncbi:hypothetical protein WR25_04022 isoform B [Diploscapter pachys]|uniref:UBR-type domain-containing protein n=1 Tax=Diploscapter pachys TaxID=2018661 RepID=A0A2A2KLM3_9BILA|nr:hypothetical protein WR25_04022 isoform B [Diploscapter pachys]